MQVENCNRENFLDLQPSTAKLPSNIQKCIDDLVKNEGFLTHEVSFNLKPADGGNYMAALYEVTINGLTENGEKKLDIFIKNVIPVSDDLAFFSVREVYLTECFFYKEVATTIAKLEAEAGIPREERFRSVKGFDVSTEEAIFLENLSKKGFKCYDRMKMLPLKFLELSMRELAKLHAMTFVIEKRLPELFKKIQSRSYPTAFNEKWHDFMYNLSKVTMKALSGEMRKKAQDMLPVLLENFKGYYRDESFPVMCHGDFRANNILMREVEGEIQEVIPIDYQALYYGNPANDILYFLYGCNDRQFRQKHRTELVDLYYETEENYLKYFNIDINKVYPRKVLNQCLSKRQDLGGFIALCFYPLMFAPEDNAPKLDDDMDKLDFGVDETIVKRIVEVIEEVDVIRRTKGGL